MAVSFRSRRSSLCVLPIVWWSGFVAAPVCPGQQDTLESVRAAIEAGSNLDQLPLSSVRSEREDDQRLASALFAEGRVLYRREQFGPALSKYERAFRYSHRSRVILDEIVALAFQLGHLDEATRYAVHLTDKSSVDPYILRRLALHLTDKEQFAPALALYDLAAKSPADEGTQPGMAIITQFEIGRLRYLTGDFAGAKSAFRDVVACLAVAEPRAEDKPAVDALRQDAKMTYTIMAEANLLAGDAETATSLFRQAYHAQADRTRLDFELARTAEAAQRHDEARSYLQAYLASGETSAGVAPYELLLKLPPRDPAIPVIDELAAWQRRQADNVYLRYALGQERLKRGEIDAALREFTALTEQRPLLDGYRGMLDCYIRQQDAGRFVALLGELSQRLPSLDSVTDLLERWCADRQRYQASVQTAQHDFLASDSKLSADARCKTAIAMAELATVADDPATANSFYEQAVSLAPEGGDRFEIQLEWAMAKIEQDDGDGAAVLLRQLIERAQDDEQRAMLKYYLSTALGLASQIDEAYRVAREAADHLTDSPLIRLRPAWLYYLDKRWEVAKTSYLQFLTEYGGQYEVPGAREAVREAKFALSNIGVAMKDGPGAEEWLEQVLDEFPDDVGAMNDLGYLWADRGEHLERARRMTAAAVVKEPGNDAYRDSYGWALFRLGQWQDAVAELQLAVRGEKPDSLVLEHLGDALLAHRGRADALPVWQRALDSSDDGDDERIRLLKKKLAGT